MSENLRLVDHALDTAENLVRGVGNISGGLIGGYLPSLAEGGRAAPGPGGSMREFVVARTNWYGRKQARSLRIHATGLSRAVPGEAAPRATHPFGTIASCLVTADDSIVLGFRGACDGGVRAGSEEGAATTTAGFGEFRAGQVPEDEYYQPAHGEMQDLVNCLATAASDAGYPIQVCFEAKAAIFPVPSAAGAEPGPAAEEARKDEAGGKEAEIENGRGYYGRASGVPHAQGGGGGDPGSHQSGRDDESGAHEHASEDVKDLEEAVENMAGKASQIQGEIEAQSSELQEIDEEARAANDRADAYMRRLEELGLSNLDEDPDDEDSDGDDAILKK